MTKKMSGKQPLIGRALRCSVALVLIAYVLASALIPAVHSLSELLEGKDCVACAEPGPAGPGLRTPCTPDAPCSDRNHHHHNHPHHDPSHCTVCSSASSAIVDRPAAGPQLPEQGTTWDALVLAGMPTPLEPARRHELARGPPAA
jgi:hypothetical protein